MHQPADVRVAGLAAAASGRSQCASRRRPGKSERQASWIRKHSPVAAGPTRSPTIFFVLSSLCFCRCFCILHPGFRSTLIGHLTPLGTFLRAGENAARQCEIGP